MNWNRTIKRTGMALADLILPRVCVVCGEKLLYGERHICLHCLADMPFTHFWERECNPMADRFNALIQQRLEKDDPCPNISRERYAYAAALFLYSHDAQYRHILYNLKYEGRTDVGKHFGRMLGAKLASSATFKDVDCVMPVPLHWIRRWRRGYNQAEVIAREVAAELGAPLDCRTLVRRRRTRTQTKLNIDGKSANVAGAFKVCKRIQDSEGQQQLKHILLIDDLFTTGSTLHACYTALREVFPPSVRISVATLGFVGGT